MAPPILLVEDDLSLAQAVSMLLENLGVPVEHCASGEVAIELVRSKRYPVVVVDVILQSGVSGLYVVSAIRDMRSEERPLVMIMTGASLETLRSVDRSIVTAVLLKPFDFGLFGQYVLATYRRALNLPHETGLVPASEPKRVRTFCGGCGGEITPWVGERSLLPRVADGTFEVWTETPCHSCGSTPRAVGGRTQWRA